MKKALFLSLLLVLVLALCACGHAGDVAPENGGDTTVTKDGVTIDYGTSDLYTTEDLDEAIAVIREEFDRMEGCELHSLTYAGDEASLEELDYCNSLADRETYVDSLLFRSSFRSPKEAIGAWEPDTEYTWTWSLARTDGGEWVLVTYGY